MQHTKPMKILIAPDSFKDCLGAMDVAEALARGINRYLPDAGITNIPMADGGEGTAESLIDATGGRKMSVKVKDPLLRQVDSFYGISGDGTTAVIEMAAASGLEMLTQEERNPWITSTYGTGQLIGHALDQGCRTILLGIGGSATNDCGMGMAEALGVKFMDADGSPAGSGGGVAGRVQEILMEGLDPRIAGTTIKVACDVTNPLSGPEGASYTYGPQKGAGPEMVEKLDRNLAHLEGLIREKLGKEIGHVPGAGAAGGLGAGLMAFLGAKLMKGFEMVAETVGLETQIKDCDIVITGEGKMDRQTQFGKTPFGVAQLAARHGKPVIGVAGSMDESTSELYDHGFRALMPIHEKPVTLEEAIHNAPDSLERTGERIARMISLMV